MQKGFVAGKCPSAVYGVRVAQWFALLNETYVAIGGCARELRLIAGWNDYCNLVDSRLAHFIEQNAQDRSLLSVAIDQTLQRQCALRAGARGDDGLLNLHGQCKR